MWSHVEYQKINKSDIVFNNGIEFYTENVAFTDWLILHFHWLLILRLLIDSIHFRCKYLTVIQLSFFFFFLR